MGALSCYTVSYLCGNDLAQRLFPQRLASFRASVTRRRAALLGYMLFLRATPLLPNTFINIAAPIAGVPVTPFVVGTMLGCLPSNFVAVSAGSRLGELTSLSELYDTKTIVLGAGFAVF